MQFKRNSSTSKAGVFIKILIRLILVSVIIFLVVLLVDRIEFPFPNKNIEKIIPNEKLKIVK
tara:strand:+ start:2359 stop:2544 length:186 start_codon:yes stop_codon:yes gene_type:complete